MEHRAPDKDHLTPIMPISSSNPMFNHLLESSHRDDSNKWSNIGFGIKKNIFFLKVRHIALIHPGITLEYNMGNMCVPEPRLDLTTSRLRVRHYTI